MAGDKKSKRLLKKRKLNTMKNSFRIFPLASESVSPVIEEHYDQLLSEDQTESVSSLGHRSRSHVAAGELDSSIFFSDDGESILNQSTDSTNFNEEEDFCEEVDDLIEEIDDSIVEIDEDHETPDKNEDFSVFESQHSELLVLLLNENVDVTFYGKAAIKCLFGAASVMSYILKQSEDDYIPIFGPRIGPMPLISWRDIPFKKKNASSHLKIILEKVLSPQIGLVNTILNVVQSTSTILLVKPLPGMFDFKVAELDKLFRCPKTVRRDIFLRMGFGLTSTPDPKYFLNEKPFVDLLETIPIEDVKESDSYSNDTPPIIMVCGPKDCGKSSFLRLIVNRILNKWEEVLYLDADPGQSEFTPSGCVSLTSVTVPLFGPSFSHQKEPNISHYIGSTSAASNPVLYISSLKSLLRSCDPEKPIVVNTMGWTKGIGISLLVDIVRLSKPTLMVQFKDPETPVMDNEFFQSACGWLTSRSMELRPFQFQLFPHRDNRRSLKHIPLSSVQLRILAVLRYMDELRKSRGLFQEAVSLNSLVPFEVPFDAVTVKSMSGELNASQLLLTVNASWVALCFEEKPKRSAATQEIINECFGFGIVRGVDEIKKRFLVITPLPLDTLQKVNTLIISDEELPFQFLINQNVANALPYLSQLRNDVEFKSYLDFVDQKSQKEISKTKKRFFESKEKLRHL